MLSPPRYVFGNKFPRPTRPQLKIVIFGPSLSARGNVDAAIYRGLLRELGVRGHNVLFLERGASGALPGRSSKPASGRIGCYSGLKELKDHFTVAVREADFVMVGSPVDEAIAIGEWVTQTAQGATAFYDTNLPATMAGLLRGTANSISPALIQRYQMFLSATGGPLLNYIETQYGSPMARPLYRSVDATLFFPEQHALRWDLGYSGGYSRERQQLLERLLLEPARRWSDGEFAVAGPGYRHTVHWPKNVKRIPHMPAGKLRGFFNAQRFALNVTSPGEHAIGFSPEARLFEAAACGTPVISDFWPGIDTFFKPDDEILISHSPDETLVYLEEIPELDRRRMGYRARERVLARHTTRHRAAELESYALQVLKLGAA
ncbi:MAG TPA: glycosyltransferase [Verrucomicrobiae bacterium]|nr:glycosyltransferase [Verrucomicrobiae bacterium]